MSRDRIIHFNSLAGRKPTRVELKFVLEDFFKYVGDVSWDKDRFFIVLPGEKSSALTHMARVENGGERWIEVWLNLEPQEGVVPSVDIITRQQDEFTNALADGLATLIGCYWQGALT